MTTESDYMTGYNNGWRDGRKDVQEKLNAPTDEELEKLFIGLDLLKPDWQDTLRARLKMLAKGMV